MPQQKLTPGAFDRHAPDPKHLFAETGPDEAPTGFSPALMGKEESAGDSCPPDGLRKARGTASTEVL